MVPCMPLALHRCLSNALKAEVPLETLSGLWHRATAQWSEILQVQETRARGDGRRLQATLFLNHFYLDVGKTQGQEISAPTHPAVRPGRARSKTRVPSAQSTGPVAVFRGFACSWGEGDRVDNNGWRKRSVGPRWGHPPRSSPGALSGGQPPQG